MKIAMIGSRGLPATHGGVERHVEEIGRRLVERGHEVVVFNRANYSQDGRIQTEHLGMRLISVPAPTHKQFEATIHSALSTARSLTGSFDITHFHALGPGLFSFLPRYASRAAVVQTIHGMDDQRAKWGRVSSAMLKGARQLSARVPDAVVVVSRTLQEVYATQHQRATTYIPNGTAPAVRRAPGAVLERFGLQPGAYAVAVGRFVPEKRWGLLARAYRDLPGDRPLVLVGGSSYTDAYVELVRHEAAQDPRIQFTGYLYGDELAELMTSAELSIHPSALEGLPLALLEAVSYELPVVASDIGPHREVLEPTGPGASLFRTDDAAALREAVTAVLDQPDAARDDARARAARVAEHYSWDAATEQLEAVYESVIRGTRRPGRSR